jgi:hypothetical protein
VRRHVAVDDAQRRAVHLALVRVVEALPGFDDDVDRLRDGQRLALASANVEHALEVLSLDVLHRDVEELIDLVEVEDLHDVRVVQVRGDLGLVLEHRDEALLLSEVREDALDDDRLCEAFGTDGLGAEDLRHPALRDLVEQEVAAKFLWEPLAIGRHEVSAGAPVGLGGWISAGRVLVVGGPLQRGRCVSSWTTWRR